MRQRNALSNGRVAVETIAASEYDTPVVGVLVH